MQHDPSPRTFRSLGLTSRSGRGPRIYFSDKFPGDTNTAGSGQYWEPVVTLRTSSHLSREVFQNRIFCLIQDLAVRLERKGLWNPCSSEKDEESDFISSYTDYQLTFWKVWGNRGTHLRRSSNFSQPKTWNLLKRYIRPYSCCQIVRKRCYLGWRSFETSVAFS